MEDRLGSLHNGRITLQALADSATDTQNLLVMSCLSVAGSLKQLDCASQIPEVRKRAPHLMDAARVYEMMRLAEHQRSTLSCALLLRSSFESTVSS